MSIAWGMVLFGSLLIVAGWQNKSLSALARGDSTQPKPSSGGTTTTPAPAAAPAPGAQSGYGPSSGSGLH